MSFFSKIKQVGEIYLDSVIEKAETSRKTPYERKALTDLDYIGESSEQGFVERGSLIGPEVQKSMARKDSIIASIIQTRVNQIVTFSVPQKDRFSAGYCVRPNKMADLTAEEKLELDDPELQASPEAFAAKKHDLNVLKMKRQEVQKEDMDKIHKFLKFCGWDKYEIDPDKRIDFEKWLRISVRDRMVYNHLATELIPTKDKSRLHNFKPASAGTIRRVNKKSAKLYTQQIIKQLETAGRDYDAKALADDPFRYVQKVNGIVRSAWRPSELVFETANPTVDPYDRGYGFGEMEMLIHIITSHLYAEAHNRNFFTQGIGTKGILHIKGENISRTQLESFKRQWFNQLANSKNAFRPPVIGMADEVKWIQLAQSNREMEFESWMHYLIKITCAIFQIDPAEINFDIVRSNTSSLNESNNETRLKSSRDKGLKPLLMFLQRILNHFILPAWDEDLASKYTFEFVGLDAESRTEEIERFQKESLTYKTINEIRTEAGYGPIEEGDIILSGAYTQLLQAKQMEGAEAPVEEEVEEDEEGVSLDDLMEGNDPDISDDLDDLFEGMDETAAANAEESKEAEKEDSKEETKKAMVVEYYMDEDNES